MIKIYTDGAAQGNPGPGGYGIIMKYNQHYREISQGYRLTTNNRMELLAVIVSLEAIKKDGIRVRIYSDSEYVINAIKKGWLWGWEKTNFRKKANPDLWQRFLKVYDPMKVKFVWIKGHAGHPENERCDVLAVQSAEGPDKLIDHGYEASVGK